LIKILWEALTLQDCSVDIFTRPYYIPEWDKGDHFRLNKGNIIDNKFGIGAICSDKDFETLFSLNKEI